METMYSTGCEKKNQNLLPIYLPFPQFFRDPSIAIFDQTDFLQYTVKKVVTSDYSITSKPLSRIQCSTYAESDCTFSECRIFSIKSVSK